MRKLNLPWGFAWQRVGPTAFASPRSFCGGGRGSRRCSGRLRRAACMLADGAKAPADALARNMRVLGSSPRNFDALIGAGQGRAGARRQAGGGRLLRPGRGSLARQPAAASRNGRGAGARGQWRGSSAIFRPRDAARRHAGDDRRGPRSGLRPPRPACRRRRRIIARRWSATRRRRGAAAACAQPRHLRARRQRRLSHARRR